MSASARKSTIMEHTLRLCHILPHLVCLTRRLLVHVSPRCLRASFDSMKRCAPPKATPKCSNQSQRSSHTGSNKHSTAFDFLLRHGDGTSTSLWDHPRNERITFNRYR